MNPDDLIPTTEGSTPATGESTPPETVSEAPPTPSAFAESATTDSAAPVGDGGVSTVAPSESPESASSDSVTSTDDNEMASVEAASAEPAVQRPTLPPQPVPSVPAAPNSQDLSRLAQDLQIRKAQVESVVQLLDDGNTVPFITRYRKERTGGLDETIIRRIQARVTTLRDLAHRKQTILRSIANQGRLTDELVQAIQEAEHPKRLEDLYLPFKAKKRTLASDAKEKGLEPFALAIWERDPAVDKLDEVLPGMVDEWKQLHSTDDVLTGVKYIIAEIISELAPIRGAIRAFLWDTAVMSTTKIETVSADKGQEYRDYFEFREPVRMIPPHRMLAINRGERENILRVRVGVDSVIARDIALDQLPLADHPHRDLILPVVDDAVNRLILPSLEREVRRELTEFAQDHAVDSFARNLHSLLMRPPLVGKRILAIDPGIRTGCKVAALDENGNLLEEVVIYPHTQQKKTHQAGKQLEFLLRKHQTSIVAIGNGTACRETELLVGDLIAEFESRRLNPQPPKSPIEQVSASTSAPAEPAATDATAASTTSTESSTAPSESFSTVTLPGIAGLGEATSTLDLSSMTPGETPVLIGGDSGPAQESTVVQSPSVEAEPPRKPEAPPEPEISFEGLPEPPSELVYVIVNEAGATEYSASPIAKEEFPNLDATARGTISIGRRLQDPLSELVKIEPQHMGVGLYQHDVRAKYLRHSVETVIESCVNSVGIDLNTASVQLLKHVSGLNQLVARELVEYRKSHGAFTSREQLKSVPQMGEARFTQAAGFLKIRESADPLDETWVHPESYEVARKLLAEIEMTPADLRDREKLSELRQKLSPLNPDELAEKFGVGAPTMWDIFDALVKPGRDPREERPAPIFRKGILKLEDLSAGMELRGEVLNVVDFGAFVDVGLKDSGLVHISQIANRYIRSPHEVVSVGDVVAVWVLNVDMDRRRVSLTLIPPGVERERRPERPPAQDRPARGERAPRGDRPQQTGDRQPAAPRSQPSGGAGPRPAAGGGGGPRPGAGGSRPGGGGGRPRGPGAPGWRSSPKPASAQKTGSEAAAAPPQAEAPSAPPPAPRPAKPRTAAKLSETQKTGKEPVYSFAQLAALLKPQDAAPPPAEKPKDDSAPTQQ